MLKAENIFQGYGEQGQLIEDKLAFDMDWGWIGVSAYDWQQSLLNSRMNGCDLIGPLVICFDAGYFTGTGGLSDIVGVADVKHWRYQKLSSEGVFMPPEIYFDKRLIRHCSPAVEDPDYSRNFVAGKTVSDKIAGEPVGNMNWVFAVTRSEGNFICTMSCDIRGRKYVYRLADSAGDGCHHKGVWRD
jgi:hypothetical protein